MLRLFRLFAPPDAPAGGGTNSSTASPMGKEEMFEILGADDDPAEKETIPLGEAKTGRETVETDRTEEEESQRSSKEKKTTESEDEEDDEIDELKELEEELEGPTEEQLELMSPVSRREILKKYPDLFKDFPYLERSYYREREYTELLPTIDDAKQAVHKSKVLDALENDVNDGNIVPVLSSIAKNNPEAMAQIADNYMAALAAADQGAYTHVLSNINKHLIAVMVREGKRSNNEALVTAAQIVNQFVFGSSDYTPPTNLAKERPTNGKEEEINQREHAFARQQFDTTVSGLNDRVNNILKNTIEANIDPRGSMTDFVKKNASREVMETLETLVSKDTRFKALTDRLWQNAIQSGYSKDAVDKIKSAYISKAKALLPAVIKKARNEALKGMGRRTERDEDTTLSSGNGKKGPIVPGKPRSDSGGKVRSAKDIPRGMSTLDFLNSD